MFRLTIFCGCTEVGYKDFETEQEAIDASNDPNARKYGCFETEITEV
jgi:hypothetical protein